MYAFIETDRSRQSVKVQRSRFFFLFSQTFAVYWQLDFTNFDETTISSAVAVIGWDIEWLSRSRVQERSGMFRKWFGMADAIYKWRFAGWSCVSCFFHHYMRDLFLLVSIILSFNARFSFFLSFVAIPVGLCCGPVWFVNMINLWKIILPRKQPKNNRKTQNWTCVSMQLEAASALPVFLHAYDSFLKVGARDYLLTFCVGLQEIKIHFDLTDLISQRRHVWTLQRFVRAESRLLTQNEPGHAHTPTTRFILEERAYAFQHTKLDFVGVKKKLNWVCIPKISLHIYKAFFFFKVRDTNVYKYTRKQFMPT